MAEIWKSVKGFEGYYEVSNLGRVRSITHYTTFKNGSGRLFKGMILKPHDVAGGYLQVILYKDGVVFHKSIHRLVAETFLKNDNHLRDVNHKNEDKKDNRVDNLEWCEHSYNMLYGTRPKRWRDTMIKNGNLNLDYVGLTKEEYKKKWWNEHKDEINRKKREKRKTKT